MKAKAPITRREVLSLALSGEEIKDLAVERQWRSSLCKSRLANRGKSAARVKKIVLFDLKLDLPREPRLYGEGFQMLSQNAGKACRAPDD